MPRILGVDIPPDKPTHISLRYIYGIGPALEDFAPVYPLSLDPVLWGLAVSFVLAIVVSLLTAPPPDKHVDKYFLADDSAS